jgi:hypothetical protein
MKVYWRGIPLKNGRKVVNEIKCHRKCSLFGDQTFMIHINLMERLQIPTFLLTSLVHLDKLPNNLSPLCISKVNTRLFSGLHYNSRPNLWYQEMIDKHCSLAADLKSIAVWS